MRLTSPQLRALSEAGISRRDFLKYVGKAAGASQLGPLEKLGKLFSGKLPSGNTRVKIELFKLGNRKFKSLSDELGSVQGSFGFFKNLVNKVYDHYDYSEYCYQSVANVDLNDLAKKLNLNHFKSKVDEGIWYVDTPYGRIQVTDLIQSAKVNDLDQIDDFVGDLVKDPIKDYWEEVGKDMWFKNPKYFDKKGLEELKSRGINPEETIKRSKEHLERTKQNRREKHGQRMRNKRLEDQEQKEQEKENQARLRELGSELDYIRAIDEALGIRK